MDLIRITNIWHKQYPHLQSNKQYEKCDRKVDALHMGSEISLCRCQGQLEGQGRWNCTPVIMITSPGDLEDSQQWTVMRKRNRISSTGRRCTVGRKRGSREVMQWKNEHQDEVEGTADKLREISMKWWKETRTWKESQHKMRREKHWEVFIWIDGPEATMNPKQLSWRNLQHIHTAGEEQEQPRVSPWISCRAHKWGEGWAVPWSTACRVTPHSGCPGDKLPLSDLGIGQKQTLVWNNMET